MKVRAKESEKKTTKKIFIQQSFFKDEFDRVKNEIEDPILLQFCVDTLLKVKKYD